MSHNSLTPAQCAKHLHEDNVTGSESPKSSEPIAVRLSGVFAEITHDDGDVTPVLENSTSPFRTPMTEHTADALGMALARPHGFTVEDLWTILDILRITN